MKKGYELSTLCGIETCMIIYGPKQGDRPVEPETWPSDPHLVRRMIEKYNNRKSDECRKRIVDLSYYFEEKKKKIQEELTKLRNKNRGAKFPAWDDRLNCFSDYQLIELLQNLGSKIEVLKNKIQSMRGTGNPALHWELIHLNYEAVPLNYYPNVDPTRMMTMNGSGFEQFNSGSGLSFESWVHHNPTARMMIENHWFDNPRSNDCGATKQMMMPSCLPLQMILPWNCPHQMQATQVDDYFDFSGFEMKSKRARY